MIRQDRRKGFRVSIPWAVTCRLLPLPAVLGAYESEAAPDDDGTALEKERSQ